MPKDSMEIIQMALKDIEKREKERVIIEDEDLFIKIDNEDESPLTEKGNITKNHSPFSKKKK